MREYDEISDWFAANRSAEVGLPDIADFVRFLPPGSKVLELGCGHGIPISRFLIESGFELFAIDGSQKMVSRFRALFPTAHVQHATIQESDFYDTSFDAVVAWGVFFHLSEDDQERALAKVSAHLAVDGGFLFTAPAEEGATEGTMNEVVFRYLSLGSANYRRLLEESGLALVDEHRDAWDNHVYVARKESHAQGTIASRPSAGSGMRSYFMCTKRIGFGIWSLADIDLATALWGDVRVTRFIGGPFTDRKVRERLDLEISTRESAGYQYWPIFRLRDDTHLGCCGLRPHPGQDILEIGFHLRREHWGQGYASEAAVAVRDHAFRGLGVGRLFAGHHPENRSSRGLLERLGFRYSGDTLYPPTGLLHPSYLLTREEFEEASVR
ncbi:MAG: GNAT family N-acetyltransferase [Gemmatimonadota bacterium]